MKTEQDAKLAALLRSNMVPCDLCEHFDALADIDKEPCLYCWFNQSYGGRFKCKEPTKGSAKT